jgi:hypothetical protein
MQRPLVLAALVLCASGALPAAANDTESLATRSIAHRLPTGWHARVRWRNDTLVAFVSPATIQESFDLFYDQQRASEAVAHLCPAAGDPLWKALGPRQDLAIEPEVMGKGGFRVSCRATLRETPAS